MIRKCIVCNTEHEDFTMSSYVSGGLVCVDCGQSPRDIIQINCKLEITSEGEILIDTQESHTLEYHLVQAKLVHSEPLPLLYNDIKSDKVARVTIESGALYLISEKDPTEVSKLIHSSIHREIQLVAASIDNMKFMKDRLQSRFNTWWEDHKDMCGLPRPKTPLEETDLVYPIIKDLRSRIKAHEESCYYGDMAEVAEAVRCSEYSKPLMRDTEDRGGRSTKWEIVVYKFEGPRGVYYFKVEEEVAATEYQSGEYSTVVSEVYPRNELVTKYVEINRKG
ncbi:hypothetical protein LIS04_209 [Listeria phage LIS04]|nr:hypothetical protein LIS04_209 [Listeria phage LIS04]